jgi:predicted Zn finger-like uncharacterized protein
MKIICDSCGTKYSISDDKVRGKVFKIRCKKCSHIIVVRGGENAAAEPAAASAPVADGWHIVVDGEQVGPIAEADVRARIERGEIKGDTYTWKEGFTDWVKLSSVPEFASLVGSTDSDSGPAADVVSAAVAAPVATNGTDRARRPSGARASLFGGGGGAGVAAAAAAGGGEDVDVFAAPAGSPARGGGDLFASPAAHSAPADEPRWPTSGASASSHDGGRVENLTGQRHENSVLFSLSNLQSLAMTSAAPKAAPSLGSTAPTPEGSGLIDIRAMAATTLGGPGESRSLGGGASDDLPAFAAFSPAAPVLLPLPSSSGPPKWIYPVIILIAVMVAGIGFMAYKVVSAKPPQVVETVVQPPAPPPAATGPAVATKGADQGKPTTIPDDKLPPREGETKAEGKSEGKSDGKSDSKSEHHHGKGHEAKGSKALAAQDKEDKKEQKAASEAVVAKPAPGSIDALLEGGVSKKAASRSSHASDDDTKKPAAAESSGPLAKSAIVAGMNGVRPKVSDCYNQYKVPGMAMVNVVIAKSGSVSSATVTGKFAGTPTGSCVEKAVKTAKFPPSDGFSTPYPFQLK